MVGIGITTHNRNEQLKDTLERIKRFSPANVKIVVVDDASIVPVEEATFRFETNQGGAVSKNKCLELLDDCEHIFLFDDDTYPIKKGWIEKYTDAGVKHLNYTFKFKYDVRDNLKYHENPNGCMMYIHRSVLDVVGGFDTAFIKYGHWHGAYSNRVKNAGLISHPFIDVVNSGLYIYCKDQHKGNPSATTNQRDYLRRNKNLYNKKRKSSEFIPYKTSSKIWYSNPFSTEKNIGKALNEFCELVPDNDWICLQDGDMFYLTPDWGVQIAEVVKNHGSRISLFGCMTNRLGRQTQRVLNVIDDNHNILDHYAKAVELKEKNWGEIKELSNREYVAGLLMLFPKKLWNEVKFRENDIAFDDTFCNDIKLKGHKLAVMTGLYVYHFYRGWSGTPVNSKEHLRK